MLTTFKFGRLKDGGFSLSYKETNPDLSTTRRSGNYKYGDLIKVAGVGVIKVTLNPIYAFTDNDYRFDIESVDQAIYNLQQTFTVTMTSTTVSTINLTFDYPIPRQGEGILRTLIAAYMKQNVQLKNEVADSTIAFINNRLN
jgi:tyrosine-protein kinase Etk/Wzc